MFKTIFKWFVHKDVTKDVPKDEMIKRIDDKILFYNNKLKIAKEYSLFEKIPKLEEILFVLNYIKTGK